jgi:hypothetical protein
MPRGFCREGRLTWVRLLTGDRSPAVHWTCELVNRYLNSPSDLATFSFSVDLLAFEE